MTRLPLDLSVVSSILLLSACAPLCKDYCDEQPTDCEKAEQECGSTESEDGGATTGSSSDMKVWRDSFGENEETKSSDPPQYDDGTIGIQTGSSGTDAGTVEAAAGSTKDRWEAHLADDLPSYSSQLPVVFRELDETPETKTAVAAMYVKNSGSNVPCTATDTRCLAEAEFDYTAVPALSKFPTTLPTAASARVTPIMAHKYDSCTTPPADPTGPADDTEISGWLYRVADASSGQVQWTEMWFLANDREAPDRCAFSGDVEWLDKHDNANTSPPVPRTFVQQLMQDPTTCGVFAPPWCGYCQAGSCEYARLDLDWFQRVP